MKKFLAVVLILAAVGGGVAVFFLLGEYFSKSQVQVRLKALFDSADGFRSGFDVQEYHIHGFFDSDNYDPNAPNAYFWIEKWRSENLDPELRREVETVTIIQSDKQRAEVDFTVLEGYPGDEKKGIERNMTPFYYHAILVYDKDRQDWMIRSLRSLSE
ncbi:MAG: hypothetical protein ACYTHM_11045 [Planctomycetota bacterium]|jgi:hypothetical protein